MRCRCDKLVNLLSSDDLDHHDASHFCNGFVSLACDVPWPLAPPCIRCCSKLLPINVDRKVLASVLCALTSRYCQQRRLHAIWVIAHSSPPPDGRGSAYLAAAQHCARPRLWGAGRRGGWQGDQDHTGSGGGSRPPARPSPGTRSCKCLARAN